MNEKKESSIKYLITAVAVVIIALIISTVVFDVLNNNSLVSYQVASVDSAQIVDKNDEMKFVDLPLVLDSEEDITVKYDLSDIVNLSNKSASLFVFYNDITCYVDGAEIYRYRSDKIHTFKSGGYAIHFFDFPEKIINKTLTVHYHNNLKLSKMFKLQKLFIGDRYSIFMFHFLEYDFFNHLINLFLFTIFVVTIVLTLLYSKARYFTSEFTGLGLLCLTISLYLLAQLWTYNYVMSNFHIIIYVTEYYMLMLFFPIISFILRGNLDPKFDNFFDVAIIISALNLIIQTLIALLTDYEFVDFNLISLFIGVLNLLLIAAAFILTDVKKYTQKKALLISLLPLLVTYALTLGVYLTTRIVRYTNLILLGMLFFILIQIYNLVKNIATLQRENVKSQIYKELAYIDLMTGLKNRLSYIKYISDEVNQKRKQSIIVVDIDKLKQVNDKYGHSAGDQLITSFASIVKDIVQKHNKIDVFRIGGDEFIIFIDTTVAKFGQQIVDDMKKACRDSDICSKFNLSFSAGVVFYDPESTISLEGAISEADLMMYKNKKNEHNKKGWAAYEN